MIKNISIKNYKLFKDEVSVSFLNHGSQAYGKDFILKNNISSVAGMLGKNGSGKSSFLNAIKTYAYFSNPEFKNDVLQEEYISFIIKDLNEKRLPREEGQKIFEETWKKIHDGEFPDFIKGTKFLENHKKQFKKKAFLREEPITFKISYLENGIEIIHELEIFANVISESIILNEKLINTQREEILNFKSNILQILKENSIKKTRLIGIEPNEELDDINELVFTDEKEKSALLKFVKTCDDNVERLIFGKKDNLIEFIENRTSKSIGVKDLSLGTRKMISIFKYLYRALTKEKTFLMIDEIENSLHLLIVKFIITLFKKDYNKMNSQLLFTTHNPLIFEEDFKRNSIYFIQNANIVQNTMRFDKKITPGFLKGELISNPDHNYRFDFLMELSENE